MSNDEKILAILEKMQQEQTEMKREQSEMKREQSEMKREQSEMKREQSEILEKMQQEQAEMRRELSEMKEEHGEALDRLHLSVAAIEIDHGKRLGALEDGQSLIFDHLKQILPVVDMAKKTADDVALIKQLVSGHSKTFSKIKAAI